MNRRKQKRSIALLLCALLAAALLTGCGQQEASVPEDQDQTTGTQTAPSAKPAAPEQEDSQPAAAEAALFIGTKADGFREYPLSYEGMLSPELLIQGIANQTGWDLTLAEPVSTGKSGMSVCLADTSSLFVGPPDPQKEEFHVYDANQLAQMILDSIQKTLQEGSTGAGGNPDALEVYYFMAGERPLELPDIGRAWPMDQPYTWEAGEAN